MVGQHDVAVGEAEFVEVGGAAAARQGEGEGQGVAGVPFDLGDGHCAVVGLGLEAAAQRVGGELRFGAQAHGVAALRVSPQSQGTLPAIAALAAARAGQPRLSVTPPAGIGRCNGYWWGESGNAWREC